MYSRSEWEDIGYEPKFECPDCHETEGKIRCAAEALTSILKHLYSKDSLDIYALENDLDELCYILDVKLTDGDIEIQRKKVLPAFLSDLVNLNRQLTN